MLRRGVNETFLVHTYIYVYQLRRGWLCTCYQICNHSWGTYFTILDSNEFESHAMAFSSKMWNSWSAAASGRSALCWGLAGGRPRVLLEPGELQYLVVERDRLDRPHRLKVWAFSMGWWALGSCTGESRSSSAPGKRAWSSPASPCSSLVHISELELTASLSWLSSILRFGCVYCCFCYSSWRLRNRNM